MKSAGAIVFYNLNPPSSFMYIHNNVSLFEDKKQGDKEGLNYSQNTKYLLYFYAQNLFKGGCLNAVYSPVSTIGTETSSFSKIILI